MKKIARRVRSLVDQEEIYTESFTNSNHIKQTVVISHGMGGDSNATVPFIEELLQLIPHLRCITYDIRGHGYSTRKFPKIDSVMGLLARDLRSICLDYSLKEPVFIGHSLGGIICQEYLVENLQPFPQAIYLLSSATKFPIPSLGTRPWSKLLTKISKSSTIPQKRTVAQHKKYLKSFDYHVGRLYSDFKSVGVHDYLLLYLLIINWENKMPQLIDKSENLYLIGTRDLVFLPRFQHSQLRQLDNIERCEISENHTTILNSSKKVAEIIAQKLKSKTYN